MSERRPTSRKPPEAAPKLLGPRGHENQERLHKALARAGLGSRREIETWIAAGRVRVNGKLVTVGAAWSPGDEVHIDGRKVPKWRMYQFERRVLGYYKPVGEVCTRHDEEGRPTVFERLPRLRQGRWVAVGRLDLNTCGLLLFTNDGELANRLMHPSTEVEREYAVRVLGEFPPVLQAKLLDGLELDDGFARFDSLEAAGGEGANQWYYVTLREGRQREVRRLFEAVGLTVSRLIRVRYGCAELSRAHKLGHIWELTAPEIADLVELAGLTEPSEPAPTLPKQRQAQPRSRR